MEQPVNQQVNQQVNVYCNNCGKLGHVYRDCKYPVMSCGNIIFTRDSTPKILMIQRKDSLCYIDFIRGKYDIYNIPYIQILFDKCTVNEKQNILKESYETLWKKLWLTDTLEDVQYNDYMKGHDKFMKLKNGFLYNKTQEYITLNYFVKHSNTKYQTPEWEFPKGRRNNKESARDCAIREFEEETNYTPSDYRLFSNIIPFTEEFLGENNVRYKYIYYIGYLLNTDKLAKLQENNYHQKSEISDIQWLTEKECLQKIRDYHVSRHSIITKIFGFIKGLGKEYTISES